MAKTHFSKTGNQQAYWAKVKVAAYIIFCTHFYCSVAKVTVIFGNDYLAVAYWVPSLIFVSHQNSQERNWLYHGFSYGPMKKQRQQRKQIKK